MLSFFSFVDVKSLSWKVGCISLFPLCQTVYLKYLKGSVLNGEMSISSSIFLFPSSVK